jgi:hypothetical protein
MAAVYTSWLIGEVEFASDQDVSIGTPGSPSTETISAGSYYLRSATASLSLIDELEAALTSAGVTTPSVFLDQSGYVRITAGSSFAITWTDTALRDALGYTGSVASTTSSVADRRSPLFWSPGWQATPETPAGVEAKPVPDTRLLSSRSGLTVRAYKTVTAYHQRLQWFQVPVDRVWGTGELNGEFKVFQDEVLWEARRFLHHPGIQENRGSSSAVIWDTALGPYKVRSIKPNWYNRTFGQTDSHSNVDIPCQVVSEIS